MPEPQKTAPFDDTLTPDMKTAPSAGTPASEATPYGPHPHGIDRAAGGADSSPLDTEPTGDPRQAVADDERK